MLLAGLAANQVLLDTSHHLLLHCLQLPHALGVATPYLLYHPLQFCPLPTRLLLRPLQTHHVEVVCSHLMGEFAMEQVNGLLSTDDGLLGEARGRGGVVVVELGVAVYACLESLSHLLLGLLELGERGRQTNPRLHQYNYYPCLPINQITVSTITTITTITHGGSSAGWRSWSSPAQSPTPRRCSSLPSIPPPSIPPPSLPPPSLPPPSC